MQTTKGHIFLVLFYVYLAIVLRADWGHCWIARYSDAGSLLNTYGSWQKVGSKTDSEVGRSGEAARAIHVDHFKSFDVKDWSFHYNCTDYAESLWELNGGARIYEGSLVRTPWGMVDRLNDLNLRDPGAKVPPGLWKTKHNQNPGQRLSGSSSSSSTSSSSLSSGSGSSGSGSSSGSSGSSNVGPSSSGNSW